MAELCEVVKKAWAKVTGMETEFSRKFILTDMATVKKQFGIATATVGANKFAKDMKQPLRDVDILVAQAIGIGAKSAEILAQFDREKKT